MIHRIDLGLAAVAEANGRTPKAAAAPQQITWTAVGIVLFLVVILVIRDHRRLQALPTPPDWPVWCCSSCR